MGTAPRSPPVEFSCRFLREFLAGQLADLHPLVRGAFAAGGGTSQVAGIERLSSSVLLVLDSLRRCPVFVPARETWFRSKALEVGDNSLSHFSTAFRERFRCCPGLYPLQTIPKTDATHEEPSRAGT